MGRGLTFKSGIIFFMVATIAAGSAVANDYTRKDIANARFGEAEKQKFLERAHMIAQYVGESVFGQEIAVQVLQERVTQYAESFPNRSGEPVALNFIGLPGIGKTAMLTALSKMGLETIHMNAQEFVSNDSDFAHALFSKLIRANLLSFGESYELNRPVIIIIDELDKVPEIMPGQPERTLPIIGTVNALLSEGQLPGSFGNFNLANAMIVTAMNFAPKEMETFSKEVLGDQKSFYDFTLEDFQKFDKWIREKSSARSKILANMFRSNTVSRLAPNTVIFQPLSEEVYRRIADLVVREAITRLTAPVTSSDGQVADKRLRVTYDPSLIDFLLQHTVYAPSGARETVFRANAIVEQLINFASKVQDPTGDTTVDRPRAIHLAIQNGEAAVTVTPMIQRRDGLKPGEAFSFHSSYESGSRIFLQPKNIATTKPIYVEKAGNSQPKPITKKEVREVRFPQTASLPPEISQHINSNLIGQEQTVEIVLDDLKKYMGRPGPAKKEPAFRVLSGFPGIGKSELVKKVGEQLGLKVIKINMQQFSSDTPEVVKNFLSYLLSEIREASQDGNKYIILFEELDKVFELDQRGMVVNRPVMAMIKDLLNEGVIRTSVGADSDGGTEPITVDIRHAFSFITMNFAVDQFGFSADPRLTSAQDVLRAWKSLSSTPMAVKEVLGSIFLPETVSRLLSRFLIMKPLTEDEYKKLIALQAELVVKTRLFDSKGRNVGQIKIDLSPAYNEYLFGETVIPSEGARHTVVAVQAKIASDIEFALANIPRASKFASAPLVITLDYNAAETKVVAHARVEKETEAKPEKIGERVVALQFPSPEVQGLMSAERLYISAHEFGHAFMAVRLGLRIEQIVVVSPQPGVGGYVKFNDKSPSAQAMISRAFATLAARAFERIVFSEKPLEPESTLEITGGASSDIRSVTANIFNAIYELGFDPNGGTIDRNFVSNGMKYADYASIPHDLAEKLGLVLRDMETYIVKDMLIAHPQEWYVEKIAALSAKGAMNEEKFYELVGYPQLGKNESAVATEKFKRLFAKYLKPEPAGRREALEAKGEGRLTSVNENIENYMGEFSRLLQKHFHPEKMQTAPSAPTAAAAPVRTQTAAPGVKSCKDLFK